MGDAAKAELAKAAALQAANRAEDAFVHYRNAARRDPQLADRLASALNTYAQAHPQATQAGLQRINGYIGAFLTNQGNARMGMYPGLPSTPFHATDTLPGANALEAAYPAIRDEIEALAASHFQPEAEGLMGDGSWDVFLFYERGRRHEDHLARCPTIAGIIEDSNTVRSLSGLLYVSKLSPGTHIRPHSGPTNLRLRCHLGIKVPQGDCGLKVGGETRRWEEGRCLAFDDSLPHEAWNDTAEPRVVLILDFWRPELTPMEIAFLEGLHRFAEFQTNSLNRYWAANEAARDKARSQYD